MVATRPSVWPSLFCRAGIHCCVVAIAWGSAAGASVAQGVHVGPVMNFINANVRNWISDPIIIDAIKAQNAANSHITKVEIAALDNEWVSETNRPSRPMIDKAMATMLSRFLKQKEEEAGGTITEVIVMDARGLNAGQSGITSDYWQGDESKFTNSFEKGPLAVFVDDARKDESTQMLQSQVSMTIVDENQKPIGAITIGVNLDQL
jgi:hypothetical protein